MLHWDIDLGRKYVVIKVYLLSLHLDLPRRGHLHRIFNLFAYINKHPYYKLVINTALMDMGIH